MIKNNYIDRLIKHRSEDFNETYEFVTLKNGQKVIMFIPEEVDFSINITVFIGDEYCRLLACFEKKDRKISLGDIQVLNPKLMNLGIGTLLLKKLKEIAKKEGATQITGWMDYQSEEQKERQLAFYKKNGFKVAEKYNLLFEIL